MQLVVSFHFPLHFLYLSQQLGILLTLKLILPLIDLVFFSTAPQIHLFLAPFTHPQNSDLLIQSSHLTLESLNSLPLCLDFIHQRRFVLRLLLVSQASAWDFVLVVISTIDVCITVWVVENTAFGLIFLEEVLQAMNVLKRTVVIVICIWLWWSVKVF